LTASRPSMMVLRRSVEVMLSREPAGGVRGRGRRGRTRGGERTVCKRHVRRALVENSNPYEVAAARPVAQFEQRCTVHASPLRIPTQQNANKEPRAEQAVNRKPKRRKVVAEAENRHGRSCRRVGGWLGEGAARQLQKPGQSTQLPSAPLLYHQPTYHQPTARLALLRRRGDAKGLSGTRTKRKHMHHRQTPQGSARSRRSFKLQNE